MLYEPGFQLLEQREGADGGRRIGDVAWCDANYTRYLIIATLLEVHERKLKVTS